MKAVFILVALVDVLFGSITANAQAREIKQMKECVIRNDSLVNVVVEYEVTTGTKTVLVDGNRVPFALAYSANSPYYAATKTWYINNETLTVNDRKYVKYGLPRVLSTMDVARTLAYDGVGIYTEAPSDAPEVIYIPTRPGCEFQPYQLMREEKSMTTKKKDKKKKRGKRK